MELWSCDGWEEMSVELEEKSPKGLLIVDKTALTTRQV